MEPSSAAQKQAIKDQKPTKKAKRKTKSGCRTCKIRRVKCDEGRPSCHRCVSTGRHCDGYGIWGGGHSSTQPASNSASQVSLRVHKPPVLKKLATHAEHQRLEWFVCRTRTKLPGLFMSDFWDRLVLQAICEEPAAFHAALALSSVHRIEEANPQGFIQEKRSPTEKEQYTLKQYNKAICELQTRFARKLPSSVRVALITCVMFICMELVRGRYAAAITHLRSGMKLLHEHRMYEYPDDLILDPGCSTRFGTEPIDDCLIEVLTRLNIQAALFDQKSWDLHFLPPRLDSFCLPATFSSMEDAREKLDEIINRVLQLRRKDMCNEHRQDSRIHYKIVHSTQKLLQDDLASWSKVYHLSRVNLVSVHGVLGKFSYKLLQPYHLMAEIMLDACLRGEDESFYDTHTEKFLSIVEQAAHLAYIIVTTDSTGTRFAHTPDIPPFIADLGLNPPLYFTATKCRNHHVRLQALKLLRSLSSRENIWDSRLATTIAQEVISIEEGDFYDDFEAMDDFSPLSSPSERDFSLPNLPGSFRVHDLHIKLPATLSEVLEISCKRKQDDGSWEMITKRIAPPWADSVLTHKGRFTKDELLQWRCPD